MISSKKLLADLKKQVTLLENDLRKRCKDFPEIAAPLRAQYDAAKAGKRTALSYETTGGWLDEQLTQVAVAWVLACVFVRFLEDNALVEVPKLAGPGVLGQRARDEHELYFRIHPTLSEREYLECVFTETGTLPAMREFFDRRHNPLWQCGPSGDAAAALLDFWRKADPDTGTLVHDFTDPSFSAVGDSFNPQSTIRNPQSSPDPTRFLGDLYQDLSEAARKKYALLQTPEFIEEFILDRTLTPAIKDFGYQVVRLIDPTCGSGHFLLGAFIRLFRLWLAAFPGENPRVLAQNALNAIHGVDLNPYAVAIARFRLLLAALQVCGITKLKNAPDFTIHLASGDSLLHGARFDNQGNPYVEARQELFGGDSKEFKDELKHHYEVEDMELLHRILGRQYHAVVGNPPYITVKDKAVSDLYRVRYPSCHREYSFSVPFMERFFDLAAKGDGTPLRSAGFVGQITANAFMKREFGKKLIEEYLPRWDLTHVLDTSGAYIPGHGTPTVILIGKNQPPVSGTIRTVLGIRGEPPTPAEPAQGLVWQAIVRQIDDPGSESEWVSSADSPRASFHKHPWSTGGGGAAELKVRIEEARGQHLGECASEIGCTAITGEDEVFVIGRPDTARRLHLEYSVTLIEGNAVRDWALEDSDEAIWVYDENFNVFDLTRIQRAHIVLWPTRQTLKSRKRFSVPVMDCGLQWYEWRELYPSKLRTPVAICWAEVATHNNFVLNRGTQVFKNSAPVVKLVPEAESSYETLIGTLNSSLGGFWIKQVCHCKGGQGVNEGAKAEMWERFYQMNGTMLASFPISARQPSKLPTTLVEGSTALSGMSPSAALAIWNGPESGHLSSWLASYRLGWKAQRQFNIAWQEELDWQIYEAYDLIESADAVSLPEGEAMDAIPADGINLGERAFEIVLARRMTAGEVQTTWFARHGSTPITEIPTYWPAAYRELVERRIRRIESDSNIRLIEQPEYKRRWNTESWDSQFQRAATEWLLLRLETYFFGSERMKPEVRDQRSEVGGQRSGDEESASSPTIQNSSFNIQNLSFIAASRPYLVSAQQLAEVVQADPLFLEVAECLEGHSGFSVSALVQRLVEAESVPALPRDRYKDSGLRKRSDWEDTWRLQREEDRINAAIESLEAAIRAEPAREKEFKSTIHNLKSTIPAIAVPPKFGNPDFKKASFWKLRGKLDVPKERWVCYPGAERDGDTSPVIAWAGWDHLQQAQALAEYFLDAKDAHGWPPAKLKPLLAALADLLPWLKQWHNTFDPNYGMGLGDYFQGFLEEQCRALEMTVQEVDAVRFEVSTEPSRTPARTQAKKRAVSRKGAAVETPDVS